MRKIIIINHYGNTPNEPGATRHYELASFFAENTDKETELWICGYNHYSGKIHSSLGKLKFFSKVKINKFNLLRFRSLRYRKSNLLRQFNITIFDILTALKILFSRKVDVIILSVPPISIFNALAIKIRGIKLIVDVEDLWPLFLQDMGLKNKIAINYMNLASSYVYNLADGIDTVSEGMLKTVKIGLKDQSKTMWLSPLGVNTDVYFNTITKKSLIENKPWKDDLKIMYIGAHNPANDLRSVLNTIKVINQKTNNKKISFIFYGDGNELKNLKEYKNKLSLHNVYFEGYIPSSKVNEYLKLANICLTNLKKIESFKLVRPNKLFQYMALSKPIICGIWGESKNIIENVNSGIYVDFTLEEEASNKILNLLNDEESLKSIGKNGLQFIEEHGMRENIYREFIEKTNEIISERK